LLHFRVFFLSICSIISTANSAVLNYTPELNGDCTIVSIDPITQANEVITISGQPSTYVDATVNRTGFFNTFTLQYVPTSLFTTFPNLKNMEILNCGTTTLVTDAYANCNNLEVIILEGGNIPNVPAGIAQTCSNVITLSLGNNLIATIDANAFQGMTNLAGLNLANNQLTCIPSNLLLNSRAYVSITMGFNAITAIDYNIISGLPNLQVFDMQVNSLTYLPLLNLAGTSNLFLICGFAGNPINAINPNFTSNFVGRLTNIDTFMFDEITCLPTGTTSLSVATNDYATTSVPLNTCFSNWTPAMSETATCILPTTTVTPTTVAQSAITLPDLICFSYPEWKEILKNFHLSQWKKRCPRFHRKKVCLHKCFFVPGGDGDNDRDDRHTNIPGHTHQPDHTHAHTHAHHHKPGYPHVHKPGLHRPAHAQTHRPVQNVINHIRPGHKPIKG